MLDYTPEPSLATQLCQPEKIFDIRANLGYICICQHKCNKRNSVLGCGYLLNCLRT